MVPGNPTPIRAGAAEEAGDAPSSWEANASPVPSAASRAAPTRPPRSIDSATLFAGADELLITHGESHYRLRRTLLGKLILTK